jgi:hypothetical protein
MTQLVMQPVQLISAEVLNHGIKPSGIIPLLYRQNHSTDDLSSISQDDFHGTCRTKTSLWMAGRGNVL